MAVLGASGYTGEEVVRLLALHPNFKVTTLTGDRQAGKVGAGGSARGGQEVAKRRAGCMLCWLPPLLAGLDSSSCTAP